MDYCHRYLSFHCRLNTWLALPFFVNRDFYDKSLWYRILSYFYQYLTDAIQIVMMISGTVVIPFVSHDMGVLCKCLSATFHAIHIVAKTVMLEFQTRKFLQHLKILDRVIENNKSLQKLAGLELDFQTFHHKTSRYVRIFAIVNLVLQIATTALYHTPVWMNSIINHNSVDQQEVQIVGYFPFEYHVTPIFQIVSVTQNISYYIYNLKTVVVDSFLLGLIVLHSAQFRYLNMILQAFLDKTNKEQPTADEEVFLKAWMNQHNESLQAVRSFRSLMEFHVFVEYAYILLHPCVAAFVITSTVAWDTVQKIALVLIVSPLVITLFLLARAGDTLISSAQHSVTIFYGSHLFRKNCTFQQTMKMILTMRMRIRPVNLSVMTTFPLCSATFGNIMRMVYTYYMALTEVQKRRD